MSKFSIGLIGLLSLTLWMPVWAQSPDMAPLPAEGHTSTPVQNKPNIVFIFADDLGYGDIGAFGASDVKTPHIDSLGTNGAKFNQFYSASPVCTPSRAGLLTGRYPIRMGIHHVFFQGSYEGLPEEETTIAEVLKPAGYATAIVGKWHLGDHRQFLPLNQGFDEFFGIPYSNDMSPLPMMRGNDYIERDIDQTQLTKRLTGEAVDFIDRKADQPFFLYLAHPMPHVPIFRSEGFEGVSRRGAYGDVIQELDWSVGEVLSALKRNGLTDNTLVVFTSDNGPWLAMGKNGGSNGDLRNGKGTTFEGGIRVPLTAQFPARIPAGTVVDTPASMLDWLPTLANLADTDIPGDRAIDGQDIAPLWQADTSVNDAKSNNERILAFYSHGKLEAIRKGHWKLKHPYDASSLPIPGFLRPFLKGEFGMGAHGTMLFNLQDDPGETRNLIGSNPKKLAELQTAFSDFENSLGTIPPSITDVDVEMTPAVKVLLGATAKFLLIVITALLTLIAALFFWIGRRSGRKKYRTAGKELVK